MNEHTDFIAAAKAQSARENLELERAIASDRRRGFFARNALGVGDLFEGMAASLLLATVPFLAFAGLALWSFGAWGGESGAHWVFLGLALATPVFVFFRAMRSPNDHTASIMTDFMAAFWRGVFPVLLFGGIVIFGIAAWLGVPVQVVVGGLVLLAILVFALANQ